MTPFELDATKRVLEKATEIALAWVRARPYAQYSAVYDVFINWDRGTILFTERVSPSGFNPTHELPISYLQDDSSVARDSLAAYEADRVLSTAKHRRVEELKQSAPVQELERLGYRVEWRPPYMSI